MSTRLAQKRLMKEFKDMVDNPSPYYTAAPLDENIYEFHFTLRGPSGTPYAGGKYHGKLIMPTSYPFAPPDFIMLTPSGRFETHTKICLSISSAYHPENWQPSITLGQMLEAIRLLFAEDAGGVGAIQCEKSLREHLARASCCWSCSVCGISNEDMLPGPDPDMESATPTPPLALAPVLSFPSSADETHSGEHAAQEVVEQTPERGAVTVATPVEPPQPESLQQPQQQGGSGHQAPLSSAASAASAASPVLPDLHTHSQGDHVRSPTCSAADFDRVVTTVSAAGAGAGAETVAECAPVPGPTPDPAPAPALPTAAADPTHFASLHVPHASACARVDELAHSTALEAPATAATPAQSRGCLQREVLLRTLKYLARVEQAADTTGRVSGNHPNDGIAAGVPVTRCNRRPRTAGAPGTAEVEAAAGAAVEEPERGALPRRVDEVGEASSPTVVRCVCSRPADGCVCVGADALSVLLPAVAVQRALLRAVAAVPAPRPRSCRLVLMRDAEADSAAGLPVASPPERRRRTQAGQRRIPSRTQAGGGDVGDDNGVIEVRKRTVALVAVGVVGALVFMLLPEEGVLSRLWELGSGILE